MKLEQGDTLLMIGDSITEAPKGEGYVSGIASLLQAVYPQLGIRVMNKGVGGHTSRDLKHRWQQDVLDHRPEWLSIKIGINDVWQQFDLPGKPANPVYIDEYESILRELIAGTKGQLKGLVLMTPFYIESNRADAMRAMMDRYSDVVRRLAVEYDAIFVDTQAVMDELMRYYYPGAIASDRIHPKKAGHMAIARAFLKSIGFTW